MQTPGTSKPMNPPSSRRLPISEPWQRILPVRGSATLNMAFSGDPDDAFAFYGLASGAVELPDGLQPRFHSSHIQELNHLAVISADYHVSAISAAAYPMMADRYFVSSAGSSVGRNYGPMLAAKRFKTPAELNDRTVATPGPLTTGDLLLRMFVPGARVVHLPFDRILGAVASGEVDAGVLIHEELLNYEPAGLVKVRCLGEAWFERTGLPLPVGLNVIRRDLGRDLAAGVVRCLRESLLHALTNSRRALEFAFGYSIARSESIGLDFVRRFANGDTLLMDQPTRRGLTALAAIACEQHSIPPLPRIDII